ncbi:MAG: HAD family hydrolase [Desulfobacterium sp.]|nr:HAD family hydrolase [Desulfobacterium sp.]MBU3948502.1 HAD family hydrolase [Pseudomonadota bacterium]
MNDFKVVAFDCDGVMFDSGQANMDYYNSILKHLEMPRMTAEQFIYAHMHTADEVLANLFRDPESFEAANLFRKKMSYKPFFKSMKIEPDLVSLLKKIRPKYKTAIATNRTDTMQGILSEFNLEGFFDLVVCALDVKHSKPHPESLLKIVEYFDVKPTQIIYIGDSVVDETAAKAAGIPLVSYRNSTLSADYHISHLKELGEILLA